MLLQVDGWPVIRSWAERAEEQGWDDLWVADHFTAVPGMPYLDGWSLLGALSTVTRRIRLGPLVSSITLRGPAALAKQAVTIDRISQGRLELGIGAAGAARDYEALGQEAWPAAERQDRLEETVEVLDRLLRGQSTEHAGRYYQFRNAEMLPGPVQKPRPPLTIAAHGPRGIRFAAATADAWNTIGRSGTAPEPRSRSLDTTRQQVETLKAACAAEGRDFGSIRRSVLLYMPDPDPLDSPAAFEEVIGSYAQLGLNEFIVYWPFSGSDRAAREGVLERVAAEVLPRLRDNRG